ncbi:uncharacterized protein PHACADRAFT_260767 [Phanerochaete carnosa HHB-10118-sp]|uniref:Uncharacterized protein n=1 Tax=Phanerochaete carnosa (strain HHB-10118-sp) TaxID=650164 RepID=K5VLW1_PHACS|nr:uncharacterized protein PHACADRAFT_260767 [Phanerochaete carnosa HHB-10118-sp]EKM52408.1 hypothetical protein PHACADRAFT_260767 [Phanerochaete carnosa HHB-10118-sp]
MAVEQQGVVKKKKERTHESFIVVRPPPAKSNHPLNLQIQLVPPTGRTPTVIRRFSEDSTDASLGRRSSTRSDVTAYSSVTSLSTVSSSTSTSSSGRRMIIPLYNLQAHNVMTNVIVDAGTDAKIARFMKRGLEVIGLAVLEPIELCGGLKYEDTSQASGNYPSLLSPEGAHTPTSSASLISDTTREPSPPPSVSSPPPTAHERAPSGARKLFGKVFKRKDNSSSTPKPRAALPQLESTPKRSSVLLSPPHTASSHTFPDVPSSATHNTILGIHPTVRSPSPARGFTTQKLRPTTYAWPVQRWLKGPPEGLAAPLDVLLEVRFDWTRASHSRRHRRPQSRDNRDSMIDSNAPSISSLARKQYSTSSQEPLSSPPTSQRSLERSASPARDSIRSTTTTTDDSSQSRRRFSHDEDGGDSDPEDSETPWTCHLVVRRLQRSPNDNPDTPGMGDVRVKVAAVVPAPHHPKVVSLLKIPFPLPDVVLTSRVGPHGQHSVRVEAVKRVVTPQGVARPATDFVPATPTQAGITGGVSKIAANASGFLKEKTRPGMGAGAATPAGWSNSGSPGEQAPMSGVLLSAEEVKDAVCCTALWLVVREGFGGVGRVKRQGDGWRIRG